MSILDLNCTGVLENTSVCIFIPGDLQSSACLMNKIVAVGEEEL